MREQIHPEYHATTVVCACGHTFETGSTSSELKTDVCSQCHPFYTGQQKNISIGGRIDRFKKKYKID